MGNQKKKKAERQTFKPSFLREWRKDRGHSVEKLAELIGSTGATISRLERGVQPYSQPLLEELARVLKCKPGDIIDRPPSAADRMRGLLDDMSPEAQKHALAAIKAIKDSDKAAS